MSGTTPAAMSAFSRRFPLLLIGLGVVFVIAAVAIPAIGKFRSASNSVSTPAQVAGLSKASLSTGSAALREFTELHGKSFPVRSGAKAVYGAENQVIIWVAETASVSETRKLLVEMRDKIAQGAADNRFPFQPTGVQSLANREVYALDGMGQKHFYFQSGKYLIWLAANAEIADQALQQMLNFYP